MRKLISKPFADTPEKRDQMDKLVCDMVGNSRPKFKSNESESEKIADKVADFLDSVPEGRQVWRLHHGIDLPSDAIKVFEFGKVAWVVDIYQGWHSVKYSEGGHVLYFPNSSVKFVFCGEYVKRIECKECWGGGKEIQTRTSRFSDHGWVMTNTTYTGAKCPYCKGKGYTLERFKR